MSIVEIKTVYPEVAKILTEKITALVYEMEEIARTEPILDIQLVHNEKQELKAFLDIKFKDSQSVSPATHVEHLNAIDLINTIANNNLNSFKKN